MSYGFYLLKNKAFIFGNRPEVYEAERKLIQELSAANGFKVCKNIEYADSNANYDLFFAETEQGNLAIKLSLDLDYPLNKEFSILKENVNTLISPFPIDSGIKNRVNYSILGRLPFQNLDEAGRAEISSSESVVPNFMAVLSSFRLPQVTTTVSDYLKKFINFNIYKVPEVQVEWIANHAIVKKLIKEQIFYLQEIVNSKAEKLNLRKDQFCHGNLNSSNVLTDGINVAAINFENAYMGDFALEFALLKHEIFYDDYQDRILYSKFCEMSGEKYDASHYYHYQELASYLSLLQTLIDYLTEVYVLKCARQNRVMQNAIKIIKNYDSFTILPEFQQKLKPIADFFIESVK